MHQVTGGLRMERRRISLPDDLVREIDAVVGSDSRDAFIVEAVREAVRRRKLLVFLKNSETSSVEGKASPRVGEWVSCLGA